MEKLKFDNPWMRLWKASMSKLHQVQYLESDAEQLLPKSVRGMVLIANVGDWDVLAEQYGACYSSDSVNAWTGELKMLMESDGLLFEVLYITDDADLLTNFLNDNPESAVIATDNYGRHYAAELDAKLPVNQLKPCRRTHQ